MRTFCLILSLFISCSTTVLSQEFVARLNPDSLKKVLQFAKDTQRINTLNFLSKRILFGAFVPNRHDSAAVPAREALSLSATLHYNKGLGNALLNLGIISNETGGDVYQRLASLNTAMPILKQTGDLFSVANCFGIIGESYHFLGENEKAILCFDSGVHVFQQLGDTISSVWTMISKAHSYADLGNYAESYKTFHVLQELTPATDTLVKKYTLCHLAGLFVAAGLPESAIECLNKMRAFFPALSAKEQKDVPWQLGWMSRVAGEAFLQMNQTDSARSLAEFINVPFEKQDAPDNLFYGHLYAAMGQYEKALIYFKHGFETSLHTSYGIGHAMHANALASTYLELKNFSNTIYYANEALKVSVKKHVLLEQKNAYGILSKVYAAKKDFTKAYHYSQLYKTLNDSLAPEEYKRKLALVQVRDQLELQKKEARLLSSQNEVSQQQIKMQESALKRSSLLLYIFIAAILILVLLGILISRNIKLKRRKAELQQLMEQVSAHQKLTELEKEKTHLEMQALRAQMNPHFIFNCLSSINRFILINKIDEASDYLTKFSRLIRMALQNSEKQLITLESDLEALRLYLDLERLRFKNGFNYNITLVNSIDSNAVYIPPMLIQPFAENAIWHGLMHKKDTGRLDIQLRATGKILTCDIIDDGIGRNMAAGLNSRSAEKNKSMGVGITAGRLALLNKSKNGAAVYTIEDLTDDEGQARGTRVMLSIPYKNLTEVTEYQ